MWRRDVAGWNPLRLADADGADGGDGDVARGTWHVARPRGLRRLSLVTECRISVGQGGAVPELRRRAGTCRATLDASPLSAFAVARMTRRRACLMSLATLAWPAGARALAGTAATSPSPSPATGADGATVRLVSTEFPPYTGAALPGGGIACEITRAALRQVGLTMSLQFRPWARALLEFQRGEHDGVIGAWRTPERERQMRFPSPLGIVNQIGFMARADARHRVDDLDRLAGLRIGTVNGYANPERFERARLQVEPAVDDLANLRKLLAGRIDLILIDKGVGAHLIDTQLREAVGRLVWLEPGITELPLYTVFSRTQTDGDRLTAALTRGLGDMQSSGRLAELVRRGARWQ